MSELQPEGAMISIYLDNPDLLYGWLVYFRSMGFRDVDWCEMRSVMHPSVELTFAPCPKKEIRRFDD